MGDFNSWIISTPRCNLGVGVGLGVGVRVNIYWGGMTGCLPKLFLDDGYSESYFWLFGC